MRQRSWAYLALLGWVGLVGYACTTGSDDAAVQGSAGFHATGGNAGTGGDAGSGGGTAGSGGLLPADASSDGSGARDAGQDASAGGAGGSGGTAGSGGTGGASGTGGTGGTAGTGGTGGTGGTSTGGTDGGTDASLDSSVEAGGTGGAAGTSGAAGAAGGPDAGAAGAAGASDAGTWPGHDAGDPDAAPPACSELDPTKPAVLYLSADDSNSMASPAIARRVIESGAGLVPGAVLRTYEFLNYYNVPYTAPALGSLRVEAQARPGSQATDIELQIGVQSWPASQVRRPITVTFVLDTSGSMDGNPIFYEKAVIRAVAGKLQSGDVVNAVTWNTTNAVVMSGHVATGPNDAAVIAMADSLAGHGGTDLHGGLVAGYALAEQHYGMDRINRLVLISDGIANVGITDENLIGAKADDENKEGIYLVGVGVGDGVNDTLMNTVTDAGNGAYVYIDKASEVGVMFGPRFDEVMEVAARAVQVELKMPWYFSIQDFHGEQYNPDPSKVKPQHLAPGDAMVFHQLLRACAASEIDMNDTLEMTARWTEPLTYFPKSNATTVTLQQLMSGADAQLRRGRAIVAYAEVLKAIPTLAYAQRKPAVDAALGVVAAANPGSTVPELNEITALLQKYKTAPGM